MGFISGRVGQGRSFGVIGQLEDDDGAEIEAWQVGFWSQGEWQANQVLYFAPVAITPLPGSSNLWFILGVDGECLWVEVTGQEVQVQREGRIGEGDLPMFTDARAFAEGVVAVGMDRKVFFTIDGNWKVLGVDLPTLKPKDMVGIESVVAHGNQLAICGWAGETWVYSEQGWRDLKVPTESILSCLTADTDGEWIVCGRNGTLFRHDRGQWQNLCASKMSDDFWSVTKFRNELYISSMLAIYKYDSGGLTPVNDDAADATYYHISSNDDLMLSVGEKSVMITFDGEDWTQVI